MRSCLWTQEMYEKLASLYPHHTNAELESLTGWNVKTLQYRAGILKIKKSKQTTCRASAKIEFIADHETFIRQNYAVMTNRELAAVMGFSLGYIRAKCYEMGLLRMKLEYWTEEQTQFLLDNYRQIGDKELAEIFNQKWHKEKKWTFKHMEKKRLYLGLKRTTEELQQIKQRNIDLGRWQNCPVKRWDKTGRAPEGDIRFWKNKAEAGSREVPRIKINGKWEFWHRYAWEQQHGPIPEGMNVCFADSNPQNMTVENLILLTNEEMAQRAAQKSSQGLSDNYIAGMLTHGQPELRKHIAAMPSLIHLKRNQLLLNRQLLNHGKSQN